MSKLVIKDYWSKIERDNSAPFGSRVLNEFVLKNTVSYPETRTKSEFMKETKERNNGKILETLANGYKIKGICDGYYGVKGYQVVTIED